MVKSWKILGHGKVVEFDRAYYVEAMYCAQNKLGANGEVKY